MARNILFTLDYPPIVGGAARYFYHLVEAGDGLDWMVIAPKTDAAFEGSVAVRRLTLLGPRWMWPRWLLLVWHMLRIVRKEKPTMLHAGQVLPVGTAAFIVSRLTGIPYVVYAFGLDITGSVSKRKSWIRNHVLRSAFRVITISGFTKSKVQEAGVVPERILMLPPGCSILPHTQDAERAKQFRARHMLTGKTVFLTVCRLVHRKGVDLMIEAFARVAKLNDDVACMIVGDGPERAALEELARKHGIQDRVIFLGQINDADLPTVFTACDVFVMAPREESNSDVEGFGIVYLEANAFAKPVIGTRTGGVPDAVHDADNGLLIPQNDVTALSGAMERLYRDAGLRATLGARGQERVFSEAQWSKRVQVLRHLFRVSTDNDAPLVSIVIPTYQHGHTLIRCLRAIFLQTYGRFEVIIVNDGSTDNTLDALKPFLGKVTLINQENQGRPRARNRGADEAHGTYILFCDADVVMKTTMLEKMVHALEKHPDASYAYASYRFGWKRFPLFPFSAEKLRSMPFPHTTSLIRRKHFPGFDPNVERLQDWDLWLTMLEQGHIGTWVPEVLFQVLTEGKGRLSSWFPSFFLRFPWQRLGFHLNRVESYKNAVMRIKQKHHLA